MANVSKGAAIVTSRSRSLLLSGQTSDVKGRVTAAGVVTSGSLFFRDGTQMSVALISQA